ncbi:MAG: polysaccharide deacetylase family protein [Thermoleophilaceae bacterium]
MARVRHKLVRSLQFLLLPLSVIPLVWVGPQILESHHLFDRRHNSGPLAAPVVSLSAWQKQRFQPVAPYSGVVPVLSYGEISDDPKAGPLAVTRREFAQQMAALHWMGFRAITLDQYLRMRAGDVRGLPPRPILITFDGGRLDSYRGAHRVLQREGFHAAMFVVSDQVRRQNPAFLMWKELHAMAKSHVWEIEPYAAKGYTRIAFDARGDMGPFYAARRYTRSAGLESFADYAQRVTLDVFAARDALRDQGFQPRAFAVPEGDYGQLATNDPRIAPFMRDLLSREFGAFFTRNARNAPEYAGHDVEAQRYVIGRATTTDQLYMWLRDHSPAAEAAAARAAAAHAKKPAPKHHRPSRRHHR